MTPGCKQSSTSVRPGRLGISANRRGAMRGGPVGRKPIKTAELLTAEKKRTPGWMSKLTVSSRDEYREQEALRVEASPTLASTYPQVKALTVELTYFDREIVSW